MQLGEIPLLFLPMPAHHLMVSFLLLTFISFSFPPIKNRQQTFEINGKRKESVLFFYFLVSLVGYRGERKTLPFTSEKPLLTSEFLFLIINRPFVFSL